MCFRAINVLSFRAKTLLPFPPDIHLSIQRTNNGYGNDLNKTPINLWLICSIATTITTSWGQQESNSCFSVSSQAVADLSSSALLPCVSALLKHCKKAALTWSPIMRSTSSQAIALHSPSVLLCYISALMVHFK
jgi:hypothetical protein